MRGLILHCSAGCQALEPKLSKYDSRTLGAWNPFGHLLLCTQWVAKGGGGWVLRGVGERVYECALQFHSGNDFNTFAGTKAT